MNISFNSNTANMLNPNVRRKKFGITGLLTFGLVGLVFIAVGVGLNKSSKIDPSWTIITGNVSSSVSSPTSTNNSQMMYTPVVSYNVAGKTYTVQANVSSSSQPAIGSTRQVAYNPTSPTAAKVVSHGTATVSYVAIAVGALALIGSVFGFIKSRRRSNDINDLVQSGQKVQGVITYVNSNVAGTSSANQNSPNYKITVTAVGLDGASHEYISDSLTGIGGLAMMDYTANPIPIDVYLDRSNPANYYVDVTEVPSLTPQRIGELIRNAASHNPAVANVVQNQFGKPAEQPVEPPQPPAAPQV